MRLLDHIAWALLCLFVFTIPWEKSVLVPEIGTITRFLGIIAFAAGLVSAFRRPAKRQIKPRLGQGAFVF